MTGMKKWCWLLLMALLLSCTDRGNRSIVILYDNDVHCNVEGYSAMKGLADACGDTAWTALVSSGDFLNGGLAGATSRGEYVTDIMKEMHYDAVALGNHEFDYRVPRLLELVHDASLPVVNLNFRTIASDSLFFQPYIIKKYGNKRIAFLGVLTPETIISEAYAFFNKDTQQMYTLCKDRLVEQVQRYVDEVRHLGADYVIVLSHLGEVSPRNIITSIELIQQTRGIDVLLDGHTHSTIPCDTIFNLDGKPVILSQTGTRFQNIGKLLITPDGRISTELIPTDSIRHRNSRVLEITDSIISEMSEQTEQVLCHCNFPVTIRDEEGRMIVRCRETNAGNLVCDAFRKVSGAQLAVNNGGGMRENLPEGDWTYADIVNMLPYDNYLQVIKLSGAKLLELLLATTANAPRLDGQFPQISGFRFTLNINATGHKRVSNVQVYNDSTHHYEPLSLSREYTLCTTNYCISGGGMYHVLHQQEVVADNIIPYHESLVRYITHHLHGKIPSRYANVEDRIQILY